MEKSLLAHKLPGVANLKARKLYYSLKHHYKEAACPMCRFYKQYGVIVVKGDFTEHVRDINNGQLTASDLFKLKDAKLLEIDQISIRQYRITICELIPQEATA